MCEDIMRKPSRPTACSSRARRVHMGILYRHPGQPSRQGGPCCWDGTLSVAAHGSLPAALNLRTSVPVETRAWRTSQLGHSTSLLGPPKSGRGYSAFVEVVGKSALPLPFGTFALHTYKVRSGPYCWWTRRSCCRNQDCWTYLL